MDQNLPLTWKTSTRSHGPLSIEQTQKRFDVVTWRHMKADRYGVVTLEGRHRYSADRANAGRGVIVGLRALEVEVLDSSGKLSFVK